MKKIISILVVISSLALISSALAIIQNAIYDSHTGNIYPTGGTIAEAVAIPDDGKFIQMDVGSTITLKFPGDYVAIPCPRLVRELDVSAHGRKDELAVQRRRPEIGALIPRAPEHDVHSSLQVNFEAGAGPWQFYAAFSVRDATQKFGQANPAVSGA